MNIPKISVCIPAYNRAALLPSLLDSIFIQDLDDFEVVIAEDSSPEREEIRLVAADYAAQYPGRLIYKENTDNLGYDGNFRNLLELARGEYAFFMGNDDIMAPGALARVAEAVGRYPDVGVLLRSYAAFDDKPDNVVQTFRYFDRELFFPAGRESICTIYRRSVVISGMVIHREEALKFATDRFDGTLLYQLYLVANILVEKNGVFLPEVIALYRNGGTPDFGNSEKEQGKFTPEAQTPESSLHFMRGMLDIVAWVEKERKVKIFDPILRDIGNYSYPIIAIQSRQPLPVFLNYAYELAKMGFWKCGMFYAYFLSLLLLGSRRVDGLICKIKKLIGHTPAIGSVYRGEKR